MDPTLPIFKHQAIIYWHFFAYTLIFPGKNPKDNHHTALISILNHQLLCCDDVLLIVMSMENNHVTYITYTSLTDELLHIKLSTPFKSNFNRKMWPWRGISNYHHQFSSGWYIYIKRTLPLPSSVFWTPLISTMVTTPLYNF